MGTVPFHASPGACASGENGHAKAPAASRILVVEDDPDLRAALLSLIGDLGYGVAGAANGAEALEILRGDPSFQLILCDLVMPVMNGWQFRNELSGLDALSSIPVLTMSTYLPCEEVEVTEGAYLEKPFGRHRLDEAIRKHARAPSADPR